MVIETERLILREFCQEDAPYIYNLNSDTEVMKYTGDIPFARVAEASVFLSNYSDFKTNGYGRWAVISKKTNHFLGWCGLKWHEEGFVDLGFRFFKTEWGKGYATEAAGASLDFGFKHLNLDEIIGRASSDNKASIRVLEKLNMQFWKRDVCKGIENSVYYRINKSQYKPL